MRLFGRAGAFLAMGAGLISIACLDGAGPTRPGPRLDTLIAFESDCDGNPEVY